MNYLAQDWIIKKSNMRRATMNEGKINNNNLPSSESSRIYCLSDITTGNWKSKSQCDSNLHCGSHASKCWWGHRGERVLIYCWCVWYKYAHCVKSLEIAQTIRSRTQFPSDITLCTHLYIIDPVYSHKGPNKESTKNQ